MLKKLICSLFGHRWGYPDSLTPHIMCQRCRLHRTLPRYRTLDPGKLPLVQDEVDREIGETLALLDQQHGPVWDDLEKEYYEREIAKGIRFKR